MFKRLGIAAQLIIPFVIISLLTTLILGASCFWKMSTSLSDFLEEKSQILTRSLSNELTEPLSMGEYDYMQQIIEAAQRADEDLIYALVLLPDGRAIASTDKEMKDVKVTRDEFERGALDVTGFVQRNVPYQGYQGCFEMVTPIKTHGGQSAVLRVGFTSEHAREDIRETLVLIIAFGTLLLISGYLIYVWLTARSILRPIAEAGRIARRIAQGDLRDTVEVKRQDEIGNLLQSMNEMVGGLRDMARVANSIAAGDLTVQVETRSAEDAFGHAFKKMVASLNEQTRELASREERFRSLCQTSPVGIFETDSEGKTTYANSCWENMSGLSTEELTGKPWYMSVHPDDKAQVIEQWQRMLESGANDYSAELRIVRPAGELAWGHCLATRLRLDNQKSGFVCTIEDITKRKVSDMAQYGTAAILSETRSVEEAAPRILWLASHILDLEAAILWRVDENEDFLRLEHAWFSPISEEEGMRQATKNNRYQKSEGLAGLVWTIGRPMWMDREHMLRNVKSETDINANSRVNSAFACPVQVHHKTVGVLEFYSRASTQLSLELLESYASVATQLGQFAERLEAETSAKQLAAIVECSEDAIMSASLTGKIISWNKGAERLFGFADEEIIGKSIELVILPQSKDQFFALIADLINDIPVEGYETVIVKRDGTHVDVSLTVSPVKSETDRIVAMSVIARDITHKKAVEARMREFYAIVSHELRTPLTSIRGALGLISEGIVQADSDEGTELISLAKSSVVRLVRLINDILDLRKIEGGNLELNLLELDSSELVVKSIDSMRGLAQEREVNLVADIRDTALVVADSDRSLQVLTNLISNAIKYSPSNCDVAVVAERSPDEGMMRFSVVDVGAGIPAELHYKLFGKFQQVDSSDSRAKEGTGLGLAISKSIVEQHGGKIGVVSTPGKGTTFWFDLPLASARALETAPTAEHKLLTDGSAQDQKADNANSRRNEVDKTAGENVQKARKDHRAEETEKVQKKSKANTESIDHDKDERHAHPS